MKILIVCSSRAKNEGYFIDEQVADLRSAGHQAEYFYILKRGLWGYFISWLPLVIRILVYKPDVVHAHYGLSGFIAVLQPFRPVVLTVHGGDIYDRRVARITRIAASLAGQVIAVNEDISKKIGRKQGVRVLPCAVNTKLFMPVDRGLAREKLGIDPSVPMVLFSSRFERKVKNAPLAKRAVELSVMHPVLTEVVQIPRDRMPLLINAADLLLVTSFYEGSPQIVKEAMACNIPVVSTDVGDIRKNFDDLEGYYITGFDAAAIAVKIDEAILYRRTAVETKGRARIFQVGLDTETITTALLEIYSSVCKRKKRTDEN